MVVGIVVDGSSISIILAVDGSRILLHLKSGIVRRQLSMLLNPMVFEIWIYHGGRGGQSDGLGRSSR